MLVVSKQTSRGTRDPHIENGKKAKLEQSTPAGRPGEFEFFLLPMWAVECVTKQNQYLIEKLN